MECLGVSKMSNFLKKWLVNYSRAQWARLLFISLGFCLLLLSPRLFLVRPAVIKWQEALAKVSLRIYRNTEMAKKFQSLREAYEEAKRRKDEKAAEKIRVEIGESKKAIVMSHALARQKPRMRRRLIFLRRGSRVLGGFFYLSLALAVLSFFFLVIKWRKRPRGLGRPVTEEVECRLQRRVSRNLWAGWPALLALSMAVFIVIASNSFGEEFSAVAVAACGVFIIISGFVLPRRVQKAFGSVSRRLGETRIGRTVRRIFWGVGSGVFRALGQSTLILEEGGRLSLSRKKLLRHSWTTFMVGVLLLSVPGLYFGNLARLRAVSPVLIWLLPVLAGIVFLGLIVRPLVGFSGIRKLSCPECGDKQPLFRLSLCFKESFFNQRRCRNCGCIINSRGQKVSYSGRVPLKTIVKPFAVSSLATIIAVVSGVVITAVLWNFAGRVALDKTKEDLRKAGFEFVLPAAKPKIPDEDNAAFWFLRAGESESLKSFDEKFHKKKTQREFVESFLSRASRGDVSKEEVFRVRILLRKHKKALELVQKGASKKGIDWGVDWSQPWRKVGCPRYANLLVISRILACKAVVEAWEGKVQQAASSVRDGLFLADSVGQEPFLISEMISIVLYNNALDGARFVFTRVPFSLVQQMWGQCLKPEEFLSRFHTAMQLQLLGSLESASRLSWSGLREEFGNFWTWISLYWPFLKLDMASAYFGIKGVLETIGLPYPNFKLNWEKCCTEIQKREWTFARIYLPMVRGLYVRNLVAVANLRLARTAIEVQLFRQKTKRWPERIWELDYGMVKKDFLEDPFTGSRFRLEKFHRGVMIYSVGPDGVDDQGAPWDWTKESGDIVWFLRQ